jgi:uncharacterized protein involved in response to NO
MKELLRARLAGNALFFPAATAYAIFALPASVLAMLGNVFGPPGLAFPAEHAHEMLFGFALAVVAGNQLGPVAAALFALWLAARAAFLIAPHSAASIASNVAFAGILAVQVAPRLLKAAKKPRNMALPAVLIAICASAAAFEFASELPVLLAAVLLFALLMLFMGGRLIAPAVAGQFYRQGANLEARVQPRIEGGLIVCMTTAIATAGATRGAWLMLGALAMIVSGLLAALRLLRWRLWALRGRPDLLCLAAGYAWLAVGLLLVGMARLGGSGLVAALHIITVGSIGTLTLNVMAMTWILKARQDPSRQRLPLWGTLLIAAATLARTQDVLVLAASCWSAAFALLLVLFVRTRR